MTSPNAGVITNAAVVESDAAKNPDDLPPSRYMAFLIVVVFHAVLIAALVEAFRTRPAGVSSNPVEMLFLAPAAPRVRSIVPPASRASDFPMPKGMVLIGPPPAVSAPAAPQSIDWDLEAHRIAATMAAAESGSPDQNNPVVSASPGSVWRAPPAHRAGEQFIGSNGERIVYTGNNCYQQMDAIQSPENALNTGKGVQTYCVGGSKGARGDLFAQLAAYKKYHPQENNPAAAQ